MESEASNRQPNRSKRKQKAQIPSNSMQDSNSIIPILPTELITEILSRLPVKSLLKFRSVSKSWLSLISSREFVNTHLNKKEDTQHVLIECVNGDKRNFKECLLRSLFYESVPEAFDLDCPIEDAAKRTRVEGTCNGLILLVDSSESLLLWNPSTRIHRKLPDFRPRSNNNNITYGFGYDELRDDYKVVGVSYKYVSAGSDDVEVKIYSRKSYSWTSVDYSIEILKTLSSGREMISNDPGLFANGKLHWNTITAGPNFGDACTGRSIISFDLANEKWEKREKPSYGVGETDLYMGTLGSDLCVFSDYKRSHLGAWVMNDYGVKQSWLKKFTIRYPDDQNLDPPLFMSNKGEILVQFGSTFMIYNSKDDSFRYPDAINCDDSIDAVIYVESLVCPFSTEATEKAKN